MPAVHDTEVLLWPEGAPLSRGEALADRPRLTIHLPPPERNTGAAVIVNPGGGYYVLAADHEGLQVARWLNREGIAAFVLRYRLKPDYEPHVALLDAQRALRWVRHNADRLGIDPGRVGMLGFSAGGNLASAAGTRFDTGDAEAKDPIERHPSRPDFLALIYPAISHEVGKDRYGDSTDLLVNEQTPPTFLVHTHEDNLKPTHSAAFYRALLEHEVPAELHVFNFGPHGTGIASGDPDLGQWRPLFLNWLRRSALLTDKTRQAVDGQVFVDGKPFHHGWVTFVPEDDRHPVAAVYLGRSHEGRFRVDEKHGPVPGRYRVQVRVLSTEASDMKIGKTSLSDELTYEHAEGTQVPLTLDIAPGMAPVSLRLGR